MSEDQWWYLGGQSYFEVIWVLDCHWFIVPHYTLYSSLDDIEPKNSSMGCEN